jgi:glycerophosphoryl diester phosphodiesterase
MRRPAVLVATTLLMLGLASSAIAFDVQAHRGGRALFPENTLLAFGMALASHVGLDTLELDVGVTRDGVLVVSHERRLNPDLARDRGGNYVGAPGPLLVDLSLAEVQSYDVSRIRPGSDYARQFPDQQVPPGTEFSALRIPTLKEVIDLAAQIDRTRLNIETKLDPAFPNEAPDPERFVSLLLGLIEAEHFTDRVTIQSFDWRTLQLVQQRAPQIPTVYLSLQRGKAPTVSLTEATRWTAGFNPADHGGSLPSTIHAAGGKVWSPYFADVTPELISESHALGLQVVVWTVNKPEDMARLMDIGVDGIISDRPDLLRKVAFDKGLVKLKGELHLQSTSPKAHLE